MTIKKYWQNWTKRDVRSHFFFKKYDFFFRNHFFYKASLYAFKQDYSPFYILGVFNSKLFSYLALRLTVSSQRDDFPSFSIDEFKNFLVPALAPKDQSLIIKRVTELRRTYKNFDVNADRFSRRISTLTAPKKISKKLEAFWNLDFNSFLRELQRISNKTLTLREQDEWENYFEENKKVLSELNKKICSLESEIDKLVYELYGLTEEEINIVESA